MDRKRPRISKRIFYRRSRIKRYATRLKTDLDWNDLVLPAETLTQINDLKIWISHHKTLLHDWGSEKRIKPGYSYIFTGPPGTGKTMTAKLLGKDSGLPIFRIDLSIIISKYIGETEKNLSKVFNKAANKDWILFFDEADALFGKRSQVSDAHDRYANQEVSYLLQRIEEYPGLVILASNFKDNIDDAFLRRFNGIIQFKMPTAVERYQIWGKAFSAKSKVDESVDIRLIADNYKLSGCEIIRVVQYASLLALHNNTNTIKAEWLISGINKVCNNEDDSN